MSFAGSVRSVGSVACALFLLAVSAQGASFDEQRKVVAASPATQPEATILAMLRAGLDEGKPVLAIAEASKWLLQNQPKDALLLYYAGRAAELSGDWKAAVALYQQYLKNGDLKSATADEAVYAVYVLLLERLKDENGAYAFGRNEGGRLLVCPRARQFDTWFLDRAISLNDATAVAQRLNAGIVGGLPADLLGARYSPYFRWLLGTVDGYCDVPGSALTQDQYDAIKDLCAVITHDEEIRLCLDWAVSVKAYNLAKIGDKSKAKVAKRPGKVKGLNVPSGGDFGKKPSKKEVGKKASDAKAAAAQVVEETKLELGDDAAPPIAESVALLEKYPRYVMWVMTGWAGGGNGQYYRGDSRQYWPHEAEAKMAPMLAALSKLSPAEAVEFLNATVYGGYVNSSSILELKSLQAYVKANPAIQNSRNGLVILEKEWSKLTPDEAQKLAPSLAQVANPQASLIRAIAAGGKDYDKVMAALLGPEVWRLGPSELNGPWVDQLWHHCGRPVGAQKRDEWISKAKAVAASLATEDAKKEDPADKRLAAFRNLWADYKSAQPKIPSSRARAAAILKFTPELVPELLKDPSPDARSLVRDAIAAGLEDAKGSLERDGGRGIPHAAYSPWFQRLFARHRNDIGYLKQNNLYAPHPLEAALRAAVAERLAQGKIEPWLTMLWINVQFPEDNSEQVKLMQALFKSPAWQTVPAEVRFAASEWFKKDAMTPGQIAWVYAADPKFVCKDLLSLTNTSDVATAAAALQAAVDGGKKSPVRMELQGMDQLGSVDKSVFADPKVMDQVLEVVDGLRYSSTRESQPFANLLFDYVNKQREPVLLHRTAAHLWQYAVSAPYSRGYQLMVDMTASVLEQDPAAAMALANTGVETCSRAKGVYGTNPALKMPEIKAIIGKAAMKLGLAVIPVAQTDPAYPIYKSQADWQGGNEDSAWTLCSEHWDQLLPVHRNLSMDYLMWLLQRTIYNRDESRQETLIKALQAWAREPNTTVTISQKIGFEIAYGDMAVQRGMLKEAHEIFTRTAQEKAYDGTKEQHTAILRKARVERMAKNYDAALQTLGELEMEKVPELWSAIRYARAEVNFDRGEYNDVAKDVDAILAREPDNAESRILQGKVQIKRQKLMEATEVEIGSVSNLVRLVPGEKLKVTLNDPALAVSSAGTEIEVVVWANSGDREHFLLRQFGDQKTKFRGEVATALGAPAPDDHVLQVLGSDEIYYAYSERFRKKMNNMAEKRGGPITVASDALLMASARKLLSEAEQRVADMEAKMAELKLQGASAASARSVVKARMAADAAQNIGESEEDGAQRELEALQKRLQEERIKPGNPVYVRVIDQDRSRTPGIDELTASVESSSGDSIGRVVLKETGPYTGWFEGKVPTAAAQAMAFAENSEPGRNPNMVISPVATYPAWRPVAQSGKLPEFKIDLNDNATLGEMTVTASEPGAKLKKFMLQTGMNVGDLATVAVYPVDQISLKQPWQPSVTVMNDTDQYHASGVPGGRTVYALGELVQHLERGWMSQQFAQGVATNVAGPSAAFPTNILAAVKWVRNGYHPSPSVIYRFQGYFYEPADVTRRFSLELGQYEILKDTHPSIIHPPQFMLAVDGKPITKSGGSLEGETILTPGVHRFEIWAVGWINNMGFGRTAKLRSNLVDPGKLVDCPDQFFDPASFPKGVLAPRNGAATVTANAEGTEFKIRFAPGSSARLLNLVFLGQEGPVPVLNKVALVGAEGKQVLPVAQDFGMLNKNEMLEIRTGDKVAVRYVDDRYVTKGKETHERFLSAAFSNARIGFEYFEMRKDRNGDDFEYYETLLRFAFGTPAMLTIQDPDMDVSSKPDKVTVVIESKAGGKRNVVVTETGDATGIFRVSLTPVKGNPANDQQIQVMDNDTITAVYRDQENTEPGVPVDRYASIRHAHFVQPEVRLSQATVKAIDPKQLPPACVLNEGFVDQNDQMAEVAKMSLTARRAWEAGRGAVQPRWSLATEMLPVSSPPAGGFEAVLGESLYLDLVAPHLALRAGSEVEVYLQTDAGRSSAAQAAPQAPVAGAVAPAGGAQSEAPVFDLSVPGTVKLNAPLVMDSRSLAAPRRNGVEIPIYVADAPVRKDGRLGELFTCSIPLITGILPDFGVLTDAEVAARRKANLPAGSAGLIVKPGEQVYIGFRYPDPNGASQWITASAKVITHPVLDVMAEDYRTVKTNAYVGEALCLRVVDLGADTSDRSDTVTVLLKAKSGAQYSVQLNEVDTHTGVFKGACLLAYAKTGSESSTNSSDYDVKANGFPVVYGDVMGARYTDAKGRATDTLRVSICKGADGSIEPFSKKYEDAGMAMRTQFALAESSLEVARNYRANGQTNSADREYASAKQLLASVVDQFRDPETRAHAEYLLGSLTLEEAENSDNAELKVSRYRAALSRFMNVTGSYPDTLHASKAQFKIATVYEKLKEPDIAAQEYVKLAYKYPDSEFLATAMARLGAHFQRKAAEYEKQAKPLLEKAGDKDAQFEGAGLQKMAVNEYLKAANIFSRLLERFPSHELAGTGGLRAGQSFMRAGDNRQAIKVLLQVANNDSYNGPDIRAQSMYWAGMSYETLKEPMAAYSIYKRLTYDFPESKWASYARAQLSQEGLLNLETDLEIKRLEQKK